MTGAWLLAEAFRDHPDDVAAAFEQYEREQLPYVTYAQHLTAPGGEVLVPATQQEIDARNQRLGALTPPGVTQSRSKAGKNHHRTSA